MLSFSGSAPDVVVKDQPNIFAYGFIESIVGQTPTPTTWHWSLLFVDAYMGSRSYMETLQSRIASVVPWNRPLATSFHSAALAHAFGITGNAWSVGLG